MTILLNIPVQAAKVMAHVLFGTDQADQRLLAAKGEAQYLVTMGR
jgi:hypothetical protein